VKRALEGAVISPPLANIYLHYSGLASSLGEKRSPQDQEFPSLDSKAFVAGPVFGSNRTSVFGLTPDSLYHKTSFTTIR
jgi:hypothetical protein